MDDGIELLRDTAYVVIGLGVLGIQRAQVQRRQLTKKLSKLEDNLPPAMRDSLSAVCGLMRVAVPGRR